MTIKLGHKLLSVCYPRRQSPPAINQVATPVSCLTWVTTLALQLGQIACCGLSPKWAGGTNIMPGWAWIMTGGAFIMFDCWGLYGSWVTCVDCMYEGGLSWCTGKSGCVGYSGLSALIQNKNDSKQQKIQNILFKL